MSPSVVAAAILCLVPTLSPRLADQHAQVITKVTFNIDEIAVLVVTGSRESTWRTGCVHGIGGAGTFGLGYGYRRWACAPLKIQAQMSLQAYFDKGAPGSWGHAIIHYLGARTLQEPEARRRIELFEATRERLACACSR